MATTIGKAQEKIFGADGLGASNFKMFPGSSREIDSERIAEQLLAAIEEIANDKAEPVQL